METNRCIRARNIPVEILVEHLRLDRSSTRLRVVTIGRDVQGKKVGSSSDGARATTYSGDGGGDGTTSCGSIDSERVEEARLARESQHACHDQRLPNKNLPAVWATYTSIRVSVPAVGRRPQCRRIKFETANVSTARERETTCQGYGRATQRPGNHSNIPGRLEH